MNASNQIKTLVASLAAVAFVGTAMAQGTPPNPSVTNPAQGAGQQSSQTTPMGTTGTPGAGGSTIGAGKTSGTTTGATAGTTGSSTMTGSSTAGSTSGSTMGAGSSTDTAAAPTTTRMKAKAKTKRMAKSNKTDRG